MQRRTIHKDGLAQDKPMVIGSGYVERRLCDGQGLCSPGAWAPEDRCYPSSNLWTGLSRLFLATAESLSSLQLLIRTRSGSSRKVSVQSRCGEPIER